MVMTIQNRFDVNGLMVNVALLGGRQVLLLDKTEGCLEEFFKCNSDLVESWFEWIHTTSLLAMPSRSRMVWLRFAGVPLKAWAWSEMFHRDVLYSLMKTQEQIVFKKNGGWIRSGDWSGNDEIRQARNQASKIRGSDSAGLCDVNGLAKHGPGREESIGPNDFGDELQLDESGSGGVPISISGQLPRKNLEVNKKHKSLGEIYAREMGTRWITARTRSRKERRKQLLRGETRQDFQQASASLSDGCIKHRNRLIRRELELEEVRRLFELGKRLSIECQNNQDEVMSRLVSLEERDTAGFEKA
ncbi:hypothetical protein SLEP1_g28814 [Rubroshorea leprosula]|uniref:DUF4283 domain-containing protein n=1 Tax=Rubroshorea leprosula TaxID=152421 RepID=A0AAV5K4B5_9ROSI|nr:hypothetical protein SLEP1_g28814 [Rubroshorea leprosula]